MARVAIVSYDVQVIHGKAGGVGAFVTRWANLLRKAGDDVTIILTRSDAEPMSVDLHWRARYEANDISLIELQSSPPSAARWPEIPTMRVSELLAPILESFDVAYFQDWGNAGFHYLRERRFHQRKGPVCITVLHGPSEWELSSNEQFPQLPNDLHLSFQERYAARHSDFVVSPSRYMVKHLTELGWKFPAEVDVLGLPMPEHATHTALSSPEIKTIVYFGRIEERKGIRLFVKAMQQFAGRNATRPDITLLGAISNPALLELARHALRATGFSVKTLSNLDNEQAIKFLNDNAAATLCVVPSPSDNFPYTVVEASCVSGLNLIACRGGGVPEILGNSAKQLSEPYADDVAAKIEERLHSPLNATELSRYDCVAANERWLAFHARALDAALLSTSDAIPSAPPSVDVCTTYFQKAPYLEQFVDALEMQTESDFHVIAVNDGSPDEAANRVFETQAARVAGRGWKFFSQANTFVDVARNNAAAHGQGDLLLFIDSDDVPAINAVARMREAMTLSDVDALICSSYLFASDRAPWDRETGVPTVPPYAVCVPLGIDLVGGLVNPASFGGSMFMVKRSAFEAVGGFTHMRGAGHEDWELYVRLVLSGYEVDVLPEFLHFYRQVEGSLARTLSPAASQRRLLSAYEERMATAGLTGGALALLGLFQRGQEMRSQIEILEAQMDAPHVGYSFFSGATKRFESDTFPLPLRKLQAWYRSTVPLEMRLKIHRRLLAPFLGPYKPPHV